MHFVIDFAANGIIAREMNIAPDDARKTLDYVRSSCAEDFGAQEDWDPAVQGTCESWLHDQFSEPSGFAWKAARSAGTGIVVISLQRAPAGTGGTWGSGYQEVLVMPNVGYCRSCGALVMQDGQEVHERFHAWLDEQLAAAQSRYR